MRLPALLILALIFCSFWDEKNTNPVDIGTTFIDWNKATVSSLREQSKSDEETKVRAFYENRLAAFYAYIDIKTENHLNKSSIRYKFLEQIQSRLGEDAFIIEANTSGEGVDIRSIVLYPKAEKKVDVEIYRYNLQGWRRDTAFKDYGLSVDTAILKGRVKGAKGHNYDDVTISYFQQGKVAASEFFLFGTLANETVKKIVSIR